MKAWIIYYPDGDDFTAEVVRAETRGKARFHNTFVDECETDPLELRVTRCPELDGDFEITERQLIEIAGFWMPCNGCDETIDKETKDKKYDADECVWCPNCAKNRKM